MPTATVQPVKTLTMVDEATSGPATAAGTLAVPETCLTAREIIRRRVFHEVAAHNAALASGSSASFNGLVRPGETEARLNAPLRGGDSGSRRLIDAEKQFQVAVRAFERNGFLMFVRDRQVEDLDEVVELAEDTEVSFLKLIALVGG